MTAAHALERAIVRTDFPSYVRYVFRKEHGVSLGDQDYVELVSETVADFAQGETTRLLINLPPQHLKTFVGTTCLASFLLGTRPHLRILLVTYSDEFAEALCENVRRVMKAPWYSRIFQTRVQTGHSRKSDFRTGAGGGVFAVGALGSITGRAADVIIYDDPHQMNDCQYADRLAAVRNNFTNLLSRLSDPERGRVMVIAHRISEHDLSAALLEDGGWTHLRLPLIATQRVSFPLAGRCWVREKGDLLRPNAYSAARIEHLRRNQVSPSFDFYYQQGDQDGSSLRISAECFQTFSAKRRADRPVVLSIDPGQGGNGSYSVIQAWFADGRHFYLLDQFRELCDFQTLRRSLGRFNVKYRPSVVLIENAAYGPALYSSMQGRAGFEMNLVKPRTSKTERLSAHLHKICGGAIFLPCEALWIEAFIDEVVHFPAEFDDQVDAMTQYLDFMDTSPTLKPREPRALGVVASASNYRGFGSYWPARGPFR